MSTTDVYGISMTFVDISGVCTQRRRRALFVPPPTRLELQTSPYVSNTEYELNMRRKAEIFKHADPSTGLTRKMAFSQLTNPSISNRNFTVEMLQNILEGDDSCIPTNNLIPTPSSSCNIPGPVFDLYLDPDIPLYNYSVSPDAASELFVEDKNAFLTYIVNDFPVKTYTISELFVLYIANNIKNPLTGFAFTLPFTMTATINNQPILSGFINKVYVYCYYNNTLISTNDPGVYAFLPFLKDIIPEVSNPVYLPNIGQQSCNVIISVQNFTMTTTSGFVLDIKTVIVPNQGVNINILGNPTGGNGLVIREL